MKVRGEHRTVIMANSQEPPLFILNSGAALSSLELMHYVSRGLENYQRAIHISYAFSYDVNMMVRDIPPKLIMDLWEGDTIIWEGFKIQYRPRKSFTLHRVKNGKWIGGTIWDVYGFCQSSFVKALESYHIESAVDMIKRMKANRPTFKYKQLRQVTAYCQEECRALADLGSRIAEYFETAELKLTRFDGAGAAGAALLRKYNIASFKGKLPKDVEQMARHGYFGGRVEIAQFGTTDKQIYRYDINSAYPNIAQHLPCLEHGLWGYDHGFDKDSFGIWEVEWNYEQGNPLYPFAWRNKRGNIYFPRSGKGYYWTPEVVQALRFQPEYTGQLRIHGGLVFRSGCDHKPFDFIPSVYRQRKEWKAQGIGAEKALKLALNSVYGKLAQQVSHNNKVPRYHQLAWAGYITSATRAMLYAAAMQSPESALMMATDAIYSLVPLKLDTGDNLGQWDAAIYDGGLIAQSGVYWMGPGETPGGSRGFDADTLSRKGIIDAWRRNEAEYPAMHTRFVGMGEAVGLGRWHDWLKWIEAPRNLKLMPDGTKRMLIPGQPVRPHIRLVPTWATEPLDMGDLSYPIIRPWDNGGSYEWNEQRALKDSDTWRI